jgi:hypothetical protein
MLICWRKGPYGSKMFDENFVQFVEDAILNKKEGGIFVLLILDLL